MKEKNVTKGYTLLLRRKIRNKMLMSLFFPLYLIFSEETRMPKPNTCNEPNVAFLPFQFAVDSLFGDPTRMRKGRDGPSVSEWSALEGQVLGHWYL